MKWLITLPLPLLVIILTGCTSTLGRQLKSYGFTELQPPSRLVPPGTVIRIIDANPMVVGIVCPQGKAFGAKVTDDIQSSKSATSSLAKKLSSSFKLEANYLDRINAKVGAKSVKDIQFKLSNVKIWEIPDTAIYEHVANRATSCTQAIRDRQAQGSKVSLVNSVIEADVDYTLAFDRNLDANIKAKITAEVAAELGGSFSSVGTDNIVGKNLYWGIRDDASGLAIGPKMLPPTGGRTRVPLLPAGGMVGRIVIE